MSSPAKLAVAVALAAALVAAEARAASERFALLYKAAGDVAGCPSAAALARAVERRLGRSPWSDKASRRIDVRITRAGAKLHARVRLLDAGGAVRGVRVLSAAAGECAELGGAVALAVSIAIDPSRALTAPPARPSTTSRAKATTSRPVAGAPARTPASKPATAPLPPSPSRAAAAAPPKTAGAAKPAAPPRVASLAPAKAAGATASSVTARARGSGTPLSWALRSAFHVAVGAAPAASAGASLQLSLRRRWLRLAIEARFDSRARGALLADATVDALLVGGAVLGCGVWRWLYGCAGVTAGALLGGGEGLADAARVGSAFVAPSVRGGVTIPFSGAWRPTTSSPAGRLFGYAFGQLDVPLVRARYVETATGEQLWRAPPVAALFGVGLGVRVW